MRRWLSLILLVPLLLVLPGTSTAAGGDCMANLVAYWPATEDSSATTASNALPGGGPLRPNPTAPQFGSGQLAPWLPPAILASAGAIEQSPGSRLDLVGPLVAADTGEFTVGFAYREPDPGESDVSTGIGIIDSAGQRWDLLIATDFGDFEVRLFDAEDNVLLAQTGDAGAARDGQLHWIQLRVDQTTPGNISIQVQVWQLDGTTVTLAQPIDTTASGTVHPPRELRIRWFNFPDPNGPTGEVHMGHFGVWEDAIFAGAALARAAFGFRGDRPLERIRRLCKEERVPFAGFGRPTDEQATLMGPQAPGVFVDLLREAERTSGGGLLYELGGGLAFSTVEQRYNQTPAMVLEVQAGELGETPEPTDDDQQLANQVEASDTLTGEFAIVRDTSSIAAAGLKRRPVDVRPLSADQLAGIAAWLLGVGTVDDYRWPVIGLDLTKNRHLIPAWLDFQLGNRLQVVGFQPEQLPGYLIDVLGMGWSQHIKKRHDQRVSWRVGLNCVPAAPYTVGVWAGDAETPAPDAPQRYDTAGSETVGVFDAGTDTGLTVATTLGPLWTTAAADLPFDIRAAGVQLRVTDVDDLPPGIQDSTFASSDAAAASFTVPAPTGPLDGLVLVLVQAADIGALVDMTPPDTGTGTPWAPLAQVQAATNETIAAAWWKVAGPTEPANYTLHQNAGADGVAACVALTGGYALAPAAAVASATGAATTVTTPATTPVDLRDQPSGSHELRWGALSTTGSTGSWTPPAGFTLLESGESRGFVGAGLATRALPAGGDTGSHDLDLDGGSASSEDAAGITINVYPRRQTLTDAQAPVNGVPKTIPPGTPLSLWTPARYAL